jgi:hypothetical protein
MNEREDNIVYKKPETKPTNFKPSSTDTNLKSSNFTVEPKVSIDGSKSNNISIKSLEDFQPKSQTMKIISSSVSSMDTNPSKKPAQVTVEQWIEKDGPARFLESAQRLGLQPKTISKINVAYYSANELADKKKNVKNELKEYDTAFTKLFGRPPNREEKEPMRPLYIFYKRLKQNIGKEDEKEKEQPKDPKDKPKENDKLSKGGSSNSATSLMSIETTKITSMKLSGAGSDKGSAFDKNSDSFDAFLNDNKKPRSSSSEVKSQEVLVTGPAAEQYRKQLAELMSAKTQLRERLHSYQQEFTKNNNRKIKFHKDIAPVENEYKKYKAIKNEIARIEGILGIE